MTTTNKHTKDYETPVSVFVDVETETILCASLQQVVEDDSFIYKW